MLELSMPSRELAARLLAPLGYDGKITASEVNPHSGCSDLFLFSLKEAADFLDADPACLTDMCGFMRIIEPEDLRQWVGWKLGDAELADAIAGLIKSYEDCADPIEQFKKKIETILPIKQLLLARLRQCDEVMGTAAAVKEAN